jgi:hypothetical protein
MSGFVLLDDGSCGCHPSCLTCETKNENGCLTCNAGGFLLDDAPDYCGCSFNCLTCADKGVDQCTSCIAGKVSKIKVLKIIF